MRGQKKKKDAVGEGFESRESETTREESNMKRSNQQLLGATKLKLEPPNITWELICASQSVA